MDNKMRTLGLIPARGGSKRVPRKNVRQLDGRPLIEYTIDAARDCLKVDLVVVSTDDEEIAAIAKEAGAEVPYLRPSELARDETPTEPVITHALETLEGPFGLYVLLQPTSPLRTARHVTKAIEHFHDSGATSLVSVYSDHSYRWRRTDGGAERLNYGQDRLRRQDKEPEYIENGAIYMTAVEDYLETEDITTGKTALYEMSEWTSHQIDRPFDLWLAERLIESDLFGNEDDAMRSE